MRFLGGGESGESGESGEGGCLRLRSLRVLLFGWLLTRMFTFCCGTMSWPRAASWHSRHCRLQSSCRRPAGNWNRSTVKSPELDSDPGHRKSPRIVSRIGSPRAVKSPDVESPSEKSHCEVSILKNGILPPPLIHKLRYVALQKESSSHVEREFTSKTNRRISPVVRVSSRRNKSREQRVRALYPGTIHRPLATICSVRISMSGRALAMSSCTTVIPSASVPQHRR